MRSARDAAEAATTDALRRAGAFEARRPAHAAFTDARNTGRLRLRAHAKSLGDTLGDDRPGGDGSPLPRLVEAAAYVQWHRLLFARFLLERGLLRDDAGVPLGLADCRDEAALSGDARADAWSVAAAHAARLLPGVFPPGSPLARLVLAPEHDKALRDHLDRLDSATFEAGDSLGWTYQFWRAAEKKRVNDSGRKIGADDLPAVTQLFTEPYMVRFLLHNTLGAWWAGRVLAANPALARAAATEAELRAACAVPGYEWAFLRFVRGDDGWRPAAGTFPGWPGRAADLTVLDPCCGSGHFLTEALAALAALRRADDPALTPAKAVAAVLRDNLAGLELDGRCVQIAAFALALAAWGIAGTAFRPPAPHVAWVGAPPPLPRAEFAALGDGDTELRRGLEALHDLFVQAPLLGSLIEPVGGDLADSARVARIENSIEALVTRIREAEPERVEGALAARGMADAAAILSRRWVLQATNVPFRTAGSLVDQLKSYVGARFGHGRQNLATAMVVRMAALAAAGGSIACVTPKEWLTARSFLELRDWCVRHTVFDLIGNLGPNAFQTIPGEVVNVALIAMTPVANSKRINLGLISATEQHDPAGKALALQEQSVSNLDYCTVMARNGLEIAEIIEGTKLLSSLATHHQGLATGDLNRFSQFWWEIDIASDGWIYWQGSVSKGGLFGGCERALLWNKGCGELHSFNEENKATRKNTHLRGSHVLKETGILVTQMGALPSTLYSGERFDDTTTVLIPIAKVNLPALWCFVSSSSYHDAVRKFDTSIKVPAATLTKVSLHLPHWHSIAAERYPNGLPEPYSDDPTQWLFHGHPRHAKPGTELHVALARLAGYRWPAETDAAMRLSPEAHARIAETAALPDADGDGLLPLVPAGGERALADRLRQYCAVAWGVDWTPDTEARLVNSASARDKAPPRQPTLDAWLRTHAARQHAKLFHDRPFLWWVTDGRADGFTCVAHYHRLTRANLDRLAYTVLGDWITKLGADPRAEAAQVLQARLGQIAEGEARLDIFVRWKSLARQPLGWDPDLNDGVRQNIRPFIKAGVLACDLRAILKDKDRGTDMPTAPWHGMFGGVRRNDHHTTLADKRAARAAAP